MCLILFAYQVVDEYPLILAANRDEFHQRPTAPMKFWDTNPDILAGRDLQAGGTWFGAHKNGRFAGLTNYRNPSAEKPGAKSRGDIIPDFLTSSSPIEAQFETGDFRADAYNGFNLIFGSANGIFWFSSKTRDTRQIQPGIHGLSNRDLDSPWPKIILGKKRLEQAIQREITSDTLFKVLIDTNRPRDDRLPDTGVGLEWERLLSPLFIQSPAYGTRSSTLFLLKKDGSRQIIERTYPDPSSRHQYTDRKFNMIS